MTVQELIEALQELDPESEVYVACWDSWNGRPERNYTNSVELEDVAGHGQLSPVIK